MTVHEFNQLPLLLRSGQVREITGLSPHELRLLRETGSLQGVKLRHHFRYYRESVRQLIGIQQEKPNGK